MGFALPPDVLGHPDYQSLAATVRADPDDLTPAGVLADWLEERGHDAAAAHLRNPAKTDTYGRGRSPLLPCLPELDGGNWEEAFGYAGEPFTCGGPSVKAAVPGSGVSEAPFTRADVTRVVALQDGENDGPDWVCVGELADGRFFALRAGCDYTGWG